MDPEMKKILEEILSSVEGLGERVARLEDSPRSTEPVITRPTEKKMSIKEFIIDRAPGNAVQMTLAIGYYLEHHDGVTPFNGADLEKGFRAAKEPVPANINDKANMCVAKGHLMEEKEKKSSLKAWVLTRSGEEIVQKGFSKKTT